ncbi:MAG: ComEA family DNA-binding protein [Vicinamibacterales bacterium]
MVRIGSLALVIFWLFGGWASAQSPAREKAEAPVTKAAATVNLNTASATELEQLPGIGAKVAARIVEYRTKKGPFRKIEELMNVQGIGEKSFLKLRAQLTVGTPAPAAQQQ